MHFTTFFAGTSQVQIDQIEAQTFDHARSFGHHLRIATEKLRRDGMLVFIEMKIALRLLIFLSKHPVGRSELGHDQPASAKVSDKAPEDSVGDASHGREHGRWGDVTLPIVRSRGLAGSGEIRALADKTCPTRVIPELLHLLFYLRPTKQSPRRGEG